MSTLGYWQPARGSSVRAVAVQSAGVARAGAGLPRGWGWWDLSCRTVCDWDIPSVQDGRCIAGHVEAEGDGGDHRFEGGLPRFEPLGSRQGLTSMGNFIFYKDETTTGSRCAKWAHPKQKGSAHLEFPVRKTHMKGTIMTNLAWSCRCKLL